MTVSRPRLLYVFNDAAFFVSHRLPVALGARDAGYEVHVATPPGAAEVALAEEGLEHHPIPLDRRGSDPRHELGTLASLARLYRRLRPRLIEHATIKPVLYGGIVARFSGIPAVVSWMTGLGYVFISRGRRASLARAGIEAGYRLALRHRRARVIFENPDDRGLFVSRGLVYGDQTRLIRGAGVDMTVFRPRPEPVGIPTAVLASRMLRDKGVVEFVEAARMLRARGRAARFVLVGGTDPGNPAAVPEATLRQWADSGVVEWVGQREDMPAVIAGANVVCLPSYREGLPKVLVEAAAAGRAIVTTDVPGCREVVRPEENGLLVPPREAAPLATALERLLGDARLRSRMGARGREIAEAEFAVERVVGDTIRLYRELTG
jgi:glycosyltransferase involved in cell wall biosynthesis